jgi:membrane protein required for colicin V production
MVTVDYLLLGIALLSALFGMLRGFVKEALSLAGWLFAAWAAFHFGAPVAEKLPDIVADPVLKLWAARLVVLIGVLIASGIVSGLVSFLFSRTGLTGTDRVVGMVFGLARGVVLIALVVGGLDMAGFRADPWWEESKLIPYAAPLAERLRDAAEGGIDRLQTDPVVPLSNLFACGADVAEGYESCAVS